MTSDFGADVFGGGDDATPPTGSKKEPVNPISEGPGAGSSDSDSSNTDSPGSKKKKTRRRSRKKTSVTATTEATNVGDGDSVEERSFPVAPKFGDEQDDGKDSKLDREGKEAAPEASAEGNQTTEAREGTRRGRRGRGHRSTADRSERKPRRPAPSAPNRSSQGSSRGNAHPPLRGPARLAVFLDIKKILQEADGQEGELAISKLLQGIVGRRELIRAVAYGDEESMAKHAGLLARGGIEVRPVSGPGPLAVSIAVDAMAIAPRVDGIILVPGEESLTPLATTLRNMGVRVESASFQDQGSDALPIQGQHTLGQECLFTP